MNTSDEAAKKLKYGCGFIVFIMFAVLFSIGTGFNFPIGLRIIIVVAFLLFQFVMWGGLALTRVRPSHWDEISKHTETPLEGTEGYCNKY